MERLIEKVYAEPLPPEETALLTRRTGGWPAGLALFHLAIRGRRMNDRRRAAVAPLERWPSFRQFFDETVLAGTPRVRVPNFSASGVSVFGIVVVAAAPPGGVPTMVYGNVVPPLVNEELKVRSGATAAAAARGVPADLAGIRW